jgi:hypothetical protein
MTNKTTTPTNISTRRDILTDCVRSEGSDMSRVGGLALILVAIISVVVVTLLLFDGGQVSPANVRAVDGIYNPAHAGEQLPNSFRELLPRDAILPIYDPQFVAASESGWPDDALVVGLEIDGDARAYPVSFLNRREIVNDHVGKTPVLVTW